MNIKRIYAIFLRQVFLVKGNKTRFIQIFVWSALDIVMWGFLSRYLSGVAGSALNFTSILLGAVLLWDFLTQVMQGITTSFFEDVWSRNFLNIFASPLKISEYITGLVSISIIRSVAVLIVMLVFAGLVFGLSVIAYGVSLAAFLLILFLSGITLGIFGVSIILRLGPSAEWFIWPIPAILAPFVGVFYPLSTMPLWMQYISHILPPSYVFEGIRAIVGGGTFPAWLLAIGIGLSIIYIFVAYAVFTRVYKRAIRTGLIARYSAESLS